VRFRDGFPWIDFPGKQEDARYLAVAWVCFGIMMRPLSSGFCCFGLAYLLWQSRDWRAWVITGIAVALTLGLYAAISLPYYGSLAAMYRSTSALSVGDGGWTGRLTNLARVGIYPIYGFHVWLVFILWAALAHWRSRKRPQLLFLASFAVPYFMLLVHYIPQAGYYCLLIPALVMLPACFPPPAPGGGLRLFTGISALFAAIALCQWLLVRPQPTTSLATGAANAYILDYSRSGIKQGKFETLASIMMKNNLDTNMIPPSRVLNLQRGGS
jgi:hypothetical protein